MVAVRSEPFRIVHLSDLHLTPRDGDARSEPKLFGKLTGMNASFRRLLGTKAVREAGLVLVTGDVTDSGELASWQVFWKAMKAAGLTERCLVLPGNHDVCHLGVRVVTSGPEQAAADLARLKAGLALGAQPVAFPFVRLFDQGRVALFGLDSTNAGNSTAVTNALGHLGFAQLEKLARLLHKHRQVPVKVVALHHSPNIPAAETDRAREQSPVHPVTRWGHELPAEQRRALRLLCVTHQVRLVVHGHLHRGEDRRVNGVRMVGAPASTQPYGSGAERQLRFYSYGVRGTGPVRTTLCRVDAPLE